MVSDGVLMLEELMVCTGDGVYVLMQVKVVRLGW